MLLPDHFFVHPMINSHKIKEQHLLPKEIERDAETILGSALPKTQINEGLQ
jgi:hypothetical protein